MFSCGNPEVSAQPFAQLQASAQQTAFDRRHAQSKRLSGFLGRQALNVPQRKDGAESWWQALNSSAKNVCQLRLIVVLFRIRHPVGEITWNGTLLRLNLIVHGDGFLRTAFA